MIKVGDRVIVVNSGETYATYTDMVVKMNLEKYPYDVDFADNRTGIVVAIIQHESCDDMLAGVHADDGYDYVIGTEGLKKADVLPEEMFEL